MLDESASAAVLNASSCQRRVTLSLIWSTTALSTLTARKRLIHLQLLGHVINLADGFNLRPHVHCGWSDRAALWIPVPCNSHEGLQAELGGHLVGERCKWQSRPPARACFHRCPGNWWYICPSPRALVRSRCPTQWESESVSESESEELQQWESESESEELQWESETETEELQW